VKNDSRDELFGIYTKTHFSIRNNMSIYYQIKTALLYRKEKSHPKLGCFRRRFCHSKIRPGILESVSRLLNAMLFIDR
jgi:hypothetical protein